MDKSNKPTRKIKAQPIYVKLLQNELLRRSRFNPQYSLRSFAKHLDMDPSLLSKTIKGQRKLTPANAKKIIKRCQMAPADRKLFWDSVIEDRSKTKTLFDKASNDFLEPSHEFSEVPISSETFHLIADPHHYVLAELARTQKFQSNVEWISKKLKISRSETASAIGRLLNVGILNKEGTRLVRSQGRVTTENKEVTDAAHKHHQKRILESAIQAMDRVSIDLRAQNSMTIAINPKKIPLAKEMIQNFIHQLSNVLETGPLEEVYQLSVSLFPEEQNEKSI